MHPCAIKKKMQNMLVSESHFYKGEKRLSEGADNL